MAHTSLTALFEPVAEDLGYELVLVELVNTDHGRVLRVYIDTADAIDGGIEVEDCAKISREISALLDVEDPISGEYSLEVSSPGMDRPLAKPAHFAAYLGAEIKVVLAVPTLEGRRRFRGALDGHTDSTITMSVDNEVYELNLADIESARVVPTF